MRKYILITLISIISAITAAAQLGTPGWYLPVFTGDGPALYTILPPSGYVLASNQCCVEYTLSEENSCGTNNWTQDCQDVYLDCFDSCDDPTAINYYGDGCGSGETCVYMYLPFEEGPVVLSDFDPSDYFQADPCCVVAILDANSGCSPSFWSFECHALYDDCTSAGCTDADACNYSGTLGPCEDYNCIYGPENDLCEGASLVSDNPDIIGPTVYDINNTGSCQNEAIAIPFNNCYSQNGWCTDTDIQNDVYFYFQMPNINASVEITTFSGNGQTGFNTQLAVLDDCNGNVIAANEDWNQYDSYAKLRLDGDELTAGQTYYILVDGKNTSQGQAKLGIEYILLPDCFFGDSNNDGEVSAQDLTAFLAVFGTSL